MSADWFSPFHSLNSLFCSINHWGPAGLLRLTSLQTFILSLKASNKDAETNVWGNSAGTETQRAWERRNSDEARKLYSIILLVLWFYCWPFSTFTEIHIASRDLSSFCISLLSTDKLYRITNTRNTIKLVLWARFGPGTFTRETFSLWPR